MFISDPGVGFPRRPRGPFLPPPPLHNVQHSEVCKLSLFEASPSPPALHPALMFVSQVAVFCASLTRLQRYSLTTEDSQPQPLLCRAVISQKQPHLTTHHCCLCFQ